MTGRAVKPPPFYALARLMPGTDRIVRAQLACLQRLDQGGAIRFEIARKIEEQRRRVEPSVLWRYRCNLAGPSRQRTKRVDASGVCHLRYAVDLRQRTPMKLHIDLNLDFQLQTMETPFSECVSSSL